MNQDFIQRFLFKKGSIRGFLISLDKSISTILSQHPYPDSLKSILSEVVASSVLLKSTVKIPARLTVQFQGNSPLTLIIGQCSHEYGIRGLVQWSKDFRDHQINALLSEGTLTITIMIETNPTPHQSVIQWKTNSLTRNIEAYFNESEQIPTRLWLKFSDGKVQGILLQKLPQDDNNEIDESVSDWERILDSIEQFDLNAIRHTPSSEWLADHFPDDEIILFDANEVNFSCTCSVERFKSSILMLGPDELLDEIQNKQEVIVTCEFCNSKYHFTRDEVMKLIENYQDDSNKTLH